MSVLSELLRVWDGVRARPPRVALILGAVVVVLAAGALYVGAGDGPELSLELYLAECIDEPGAVDVPEGQRLFQYERANRMPRRFLADAEPVFTEEDIARVEPMLGHDAQEGRPLRESGIVSFRMKDKEAFREITGAHIGKPVLFVLDGEIVMAPTIKAAIPGAGIMEGLTPEQTEALLTWFGWGESPEPIAGMGAIHVTAHFADGSLPMPAVCDARLRDADSIQHSRDASERTTTTGADGDWTVHNAEPGVWAVSIRGPGFADSADERVEVSAGATATVDLEVGPGGTITGRVVEADTGEPVGEVSASWRLKDRTGRNRSVMTDGDGTYTLRRVLPGTGSVWAYTRDRYVYRGTEEFQVREEETVEAPELRLLRGGTIRATIVAPPDMPDPEEQGALQHWQLGPLPLFDLPEGAVAPVAWARHAGPLETEPLPPGRYWVRAAVGVAASSANPEMSWSGEAGPVEVEVGEAVDVGVIQVSRDQQ